MAAVKKNGPGNTTYSEDNVMTELVMSNGRILPSFVFGVYQIPNTEVCEKAVGDAMQVGYRAVDTAVSYENEATVGRGIKNSGIKRSELFITSKLWVQDASEIAAQKSVERSLELMGLA